MKPAVRRTALTVTAAGILAWLVLRQPAGDELTLHREFPCFGARVTLTAHAPGAYARDANARVLVSTQDLLEQLDRLWSVHGDGALAKINQALARGEPADIPATLSPIFELSARAWRNSEGAFDVRTGQLLKLWGLDEDKPRPAPPPPDGVLARAAAALRTAPPLKPGKYGPAQVQLDFSGIAKGHAADMAIAFMHQNGVHDAIVDLGGAVKASGQRGGQPWKIGIGKPRPGAGSPLLATLELDDDEAVTTRGDYERYFEYGGQRYHDILDPRDGRPPQGLQSATVVGGNGAWAEATGTALLVAGPDHWRAMAHALGAPRVMVIDAAGAVLVTAALAPRLHFAEGVSATTVP